MLHFVMQRFELQTDTIKSQREIIFDHRPCCRYIDIHTGTIRPFAVYDVTGQTCSEVVAGFDKVLAPTLPAVQSMVGSLTNPMLD